MKRTVALTAAVLVPLIAAAYARHAIEHRAARHGQENALWVQSSFLRGYRPSTGALMGDRDAEELARLLTRNHIRSAFLFAGPFLPNGDVPEWATSKRALDTVAILKRLAPSVRIVPWVGGLEHKQVWLEDPAWVERALDSTSHLLERWQVDAVHVNFEYLLFGADPDPRIEYPRRFNEFFERLRKRLPGAFISTVVPATSSDTRPWKYKHSVEEIAQLSRDVDQVALLFFDTALKDQATFEANMRQQLGHVAAWKQRQLREGHRVEFLLGTGTFVNPTARLQSYRDLRIENIPNHLGTLRRLVDDVQYPERVVDGLAIFCDWETDADEWSQLRENWLEWGGLPRWIR